MLYTVPEVASILKTNVDYVYKLQKAGLIKFMKIGRLKCRKQELEAFLERYDGFDISDPANIQELRCEQHQLKKGAGENEIQQREIYSNRKSYTGMDPEDAKVQSGIYMQVWDCICRAGKELK